MSLSIITERGRKVNCMCNTNDKMHLAGSSHVMFCDMVYHGINLIKIMIMDKYVTTLIKTLTDKD